MTPAPPSRPVQLLAIDGGKTKTIAELSIAGKGQGRTHGPGLEILTTPNGEAVVTNSLHETLLPFREAGPLDCVCIGLNGVHAPSASADTMIRIIRKLLVTDRVVVTSDMVTTYCGALGLEPGAVIAAGTGSIAMAMGEAGNVQRVDGWGYLLGDDGSGYAIGQQGLRSALRSHDGRSGSALLAAYAADRFGSGADKISAAVYGAAVPAQVVASFALEVARAAAQGDAESAAIWTRAGQDLARTVVAAAGSVMPREAPITVSWAGGLFAAGDLLQNPFQREVLALAPHANLRPPVGDAVAGALLLARQPQPCLTSVTQWDRAAS